MRSWLFHPLVFYPLAILFAVFVIAASVKPQSWPREPAPVAAQVENGALVLQGEAFNSPANGPEQDIMVMRDFWGRAQTLRIAQLRDHPAPGPMDRGARVLLTPDQAAMLQGRSATVQVTYNPLPINAASGLAVSLQGDNAVRWVVHDLPPEPGTLRFEVPAEASVNGIGFRAISPANDQAYGLEITRVVVTPHAE